MPTLPNEYLKLIRVFVPLFSNLVWQHAQVLLVGTILTPGQRTVAAALRIMGLNAERQFQTYHRVLNRAACKTQALLCTDLNVKPVQIVKWFVLRWQLEVTFHEVREHKVQVAQA